MSRYLSRLRDIPKNTPEVGVKEVKKVVYSLSSPHPQAHFSPNDPGPVAHRWRVSPPGGAPFELSAYPACLLADIQATNPGAKVEPIPLPTGGHLPPENEAIIRTVLKTWEATPDETRDAIQEAAVNPALLVGWRRESGKLPGSELTKPTEVLFSLSSPHPQAHFSEMPMLNDRITCQQCRRLKPGGLCGSPVWGPRYHPPARPHRCAEFQPKPGAADPRSGAQRWPGLGEGRP